MDAGDFCVFLPKAIGTSEIVAGNYCHNGECLSLSDGTIAFVGNLKTGSGELTAQVMMSSPFDTMTALTKASMSEKKKAAKIAASRSSLLRTGGSADLIQVVLEIDEKGYLVEKQGTVCKSEIRLGAWGTYKYQVQKPKTRFEFCPGNALAKEGGEEKEEEEKKEWVLVGTKKDGEENKLKQEKKAQKSKAKRDKKKKDTQAAGK